MEKINEYGKTLLDKTYDDRRQIIQDWEKINSIKLCSLYLPYFTNIYEIIGSRNELFFDHILSHIKLYFHPKISTYMAIFENQIIYHNTHYMIVNRNPNSNLENWSVLV